MMQAHMQIREMKYKFRYKQRHSWHWQDTKTFKNRERQIQQLGKYKHMKEVNM